MLAIIIVYHSDQQKHSGPSGPSCTAPELLSVMHQMARGITCLQRGPGFESPATCATFCYLWICWSTLLRRIPLLTTQPQVISSGPSLPFWPVWGTSQVGWVQFNVMLIRHSLGVRDTHAVAVVAGETTRKRM